MNNKEVEALEVLKPITQKLTIKDAIAENALSKEARKKLTKINEIEKTVHIGNSYYRTNEYKHNFQNFRTKNTFGRDNYNSTITVKEVGKNQSDLLVEILNFMK